MFNIFIYHLLRVFRSHYLLFADDMKLGGNKSLVDAKLLQQELGAVSARSEVNAMAINVEKCAVMSIDK